MIMEAKSATDWTLEIRFEPPDAPVRLSISPFQELVIGRLAPEHPGQDVFDLTPYKGAHRGVYRRHAEIGWENGHLTITDLNSDNGTTLNGTRLKPNVEYRLSEGDIVFLGHLKMTMGINTTYGQSSIKAKRIEL